MRHRLAAAVLCLMTACAAPTTPAQTAFALEASYDAAISVAIAYATLPRCAPGVARPCSDPGVVRATNTLAHQAWQAMRAAQAAAVGEHADPAAAARAIAAARDALGALRAITDTMKVS